MSLPINLPPLQERKGDILLLINHFLAEISKLNGSNQKCLSKDAKRKLLSYSYPDNVRELRSIIEVGEAVAESIEIQPNDLHFRSNEISLSAIKEQKTLREYTCEIVKYYLEENDYSVAKVAESLDVGKSTIYKMIQDKKIILNQV